MFERVPEVLGLKNFEIWQLISSPTFISFHISSTCISHKLTRSHWFLSLKVRSGIFWIFYYKSAGCAEFRRVPRALRVKNIEIWQLISSPPFISFHMSKTCISHKLTRSRWFLSLKVRSGNFWIFYYYTTGCAEFRRLTRALRVKNFEIWQLISSPPFISFHISKTCFSQSWLDLVDFWVWKCGPVIFL